MEPDERFMRRALELARRPAFASPNPRVGAVVVRGGAVLGEGWHEGPGTPHAEALALEGIDADEATIYVTLEPCVHQGFTPPCAPALVRAGIARVVAASADPDGRVAGAGFTLLREAGVEVTTGVMETEARAMNASYIHHRATARTFVTVKLALTLDGRTTAPDGSSQWITGEEARRRVHARRLECDAVMVGAGTVAVDDPLLTVRAVEARRQPSRVVVDAAGRVAPSARVFSGSEGETIVATTSRSPHGTQIAWKEAGADVVVLPEVPGGVDLEALVEALGSRGIVEAYCEGGATLASALLRADLVGRLELHYGPVLTGGGLTLDDVGVGSMDSAMRFGITETERAGDDLLVTLVRES